MNILFTGASSFTGLWFVSELVKQGHSVITPLLRPQCQYAGIRAQRIAQLPPECEIIFNCPFGSPKFMRLLASGSSIDVLCHHAADLTGYKSKTYDPIAALSNNTRNLPAVLDKLANKGCSRIMITSSVLEAGEGTGSDTPSITQYGLAKTLTDRYIRFYAQQAHMQLGRFVVAQVFGPLEDERRLLANAIRCWRKKQAAQLRTPKYIRDFINIQPLAMLYANMASSLPSKAGITTMRPSGHIETVANFVRLAGRELEKRLPWQCRVKSDRNAVHDEPMRRVNSQSAASAKLKWNESGSWDDLATYCLQGKKWSMASSSQAV